MFSPGIGLSSPDESVMGSLRLILSGPNLKEKLAEVRNPLAQID